METASLAGMACCKSGPVMFSMEHHMPSAESLSSLVCQCKPVRAVNCAAKRIVFERKIRGGSKSYVSQPGQILRVVKSVPTLRRRQNVHMAY